MSPTETREERLLRLGREMWPRLLDEAKRCQPFEEWQCAALRTHAMELAPTDPAGRAHALLWVATAQRSLDREIVERALVAAAVADKVDIAVRIARVLAASDWLAWWAVQGVLRTIAAELGFIVSGKQSPFAEPFSVDPTPEPIPDPRPRKSRRERQS